MSQKTAAALVFIVGLMAMLISTFVVTYEGSLLWGIFIVFIAGFISLVITLTLFIIAMVFFSRAEKFNQPKYADKAWLLIIFSLPTNILITLFNIHSYLNPVHFAFG